MRSKRASVRSEHAAVPATSDLEFEELLDFAIGKLARFLDVLLRIDFPYRNIIFRLRGTGDRLLADIRGLLRTVAPKVLWCLCILAGLRLSWRTAGRPRLGLVDYSSARCQSVNSATVVVFIRTLHPMCQSARVEECYRRLLKKVRDEDVLEGILLRTVAPRVLWCLCILARLRLSWRTTARLGGLTC